VVVAIAHRRLDPSFPATTSTVERALPSSAVQLRCWSRPTTTTRLPFERECAACSAWSPHTTTVKNDASCSRRPDTATRSMALELVRDGLVEEAVAAYQAHDRVVAADSKPAATLALLQDWWAAWQQADNDPAQ
jgi:hypothetical protein